MTIREQLEKREEEYLSPYAMKSIDSQGREIPEKECDIRPCFQRDRDRILHSKAFRRMKHKTQVFLDPIGDHYRTRLTHTLEVSQNARTIGKALRLNEDLVEAIALGHDIGHTPFGHAGERALHDICSIGFQHAAQSVRIVEVLEKDGKGLNLTKEVRDGIGNHTSTGHPMTLEGKIIQFSDKIAYLHHDIDDAVRAGVLAEEFIPINIRRVLGGSSGERLDTLIHNIITNSWEKNTIEMSEDCYKAMMDLRSFMFTHVYTNPIAKGEEVKVRSLMQRLFRFYFDYPRELPDEYYERSLGSIENLERSVCDYVAGMTDQYAIEKFEEIYIPKSWRY